MVVACFLCCGDFRVVWNLVVWKDCAIFAVVNLVLADRHRVVQVKRESGENPEQTALLCVPPLKCRFRLTMAFCKPWEGSGKEKLQE